MNATVRRRTRHTGFTLTEMLIVLAILVMLMALVVPRFLGAQKKADRQAAQAQVELFRGALERFALDTKNFPTTEQGLQALLSAPGNDSEGSGSNAASGWDGPYLNKDSIGLDPWKHEFQYAYPPERGTTDFPDIWSFGPDGEDNTADDICSWTVKAEGGEGQEGEPMQDRDIDIDVNAGAPPGGGAPAGGDLPTAGSPR